MTKVCGLVRSTPDQLASLSDFHDPLVRAAFVSDRYRSGARKKAVKQVVLLEEHTPISDQGDIGSCVANGWCDAMEMLMPADKVVQLSRLGMYWLCRRREHTECRDDGTNIVTAAWVAAHEGVCREILHPYDGRTAADGGTVNDRPPLEALYDGWRHRIDAALHIKTTDPRKRAQAVRESIDKGLPVVLALQLGPGFWTPPKDYASALAKPVGQSNEGWHCVIVVGYVELSDGSFWFIIRNSWGTDWGYGGHAAITADYLGDRDYCDELIVPTGVPIF